MIKDKEKENPEVEETRIEEKRVKATVIRRRTAKAAPAKKAPKAEAAEKDIAKKAPSAKATVKAAAKKTVKKTAAKKEAASEEAVEKKPARAAKPKAAPKKAAQKDNKAPTAKKAAAGKAKPKPAPEADEVVTEKPAAMVEPVKEAVPEAEITPATEAEPVAEVVTKEKKPAEGKQAARKEVKVFSKETELKKFFTAKRPAKKGRRFRGRDQLSRKPQVVQTRPLKKTEITVPSAAKRVVRIVEAISVADLSQKLGVKAGEIIKKLMSLGIMSTVNQLIDIDAATIVAQDYDYEVESAAVDEEALLEPGVVAHEGAALEPRAPVVTVMGHVDHGKTSLLDAIRKSNVVSDEAGGITQHIGAYHVHLEKGDVTFLDTPGHEAFTSMRARGAKVTDIVVLVVAADDGVMPQTVEAVNHAKAADVPIIVAVNKIDLPQADPSRVKNELSQYGLVPEDWGGETIYMEVSAKKGLNIKELLEMILLQSEVLELKASPDAPAQGAIIEAKLDKGRGPVATVLIQSGTLKVGDAFVTGHHYGRVRAMISDWGKRAEKAGPSMPIEILGLSGVPQAGDTFIVVKDEATARQIASMRQQKSIEKDRLSTAKASLTDLYDKINKGEVQELNVIIKGDVHGSIEAVKDSIDKLSTDAVKLKVIHSAAGGISEGDVMLATASNAIIIGFNVRPEPKAQALAEKESVDLRLYTVIYDLVDDIKSAMEGLLAPVVREEVIGRADIREVFRVTKVGNVAGCYVTDGKAARGSKVRLIRDNVVIYNGKLSSLKRFKEDAKEVASGYECGMTIEGYNDIKVGDVIELYVEKEEVARL